MTNHRVFDYQDGDRVSRITVAFQVLVTPFSVALKPSFLDSTVEKYILVVVTLAVEPHSRLTPDTC